MRWVTGTDSAMADRQLDLGQRDMGDYRRHSGHLTRSRARPSRVESGRLLAAYGVTLASQSPGPARDGVPGYTEVFRDAGDGAGLPVDVHHLFRLGHPPVGARCGRRRDRCGGAARRRLRGALGPGGYLDTCLAATSDKGRSGARATEWCPRRATVRRNAGACAAELTSPP